MKYFGTVKSFDTIKGLGEIKQEAGGDDLPFEKSDFLGQECCSHCRSAPQL